MQRLTPNVLYSLAASPPDSDEHVHSAQSYLTKVTWIIVPCEQQLRARLSAQAIGGIVLSVRERIRLTVHLSEPRLSQVCLPTKSLIPHDIPSHRPEKYPTTSSRHIQSHSLPLLLVQRRTLQIRARDHRAAHDRAWRD